MAFHETRFPTSISYGSSFTVSRNVSVVELPSGAREATARWSRSLRRFDVQNGIRSLADLHTVRDFFIMRGGPLNGFRFKDWTDFTSKSDHVGTPTTTDQNIGTGDNSETTFQLRKIYSDGIATSEYRPITKPVSGTVVAALNGVTTTAFTVDTTTGLITFTPAPGSGVDVTAGFEFDVPVVFGSELEGGLQIDYTAFDAGSVPSVPLIEIPEPDPLAGEFFFGGAANLGDLSGDATVALTTGRAINFTLNGAGHKIKLPDTTDLPTGGPYFYFTNDDAAESVTIADSTGGTVGTVAALATKVILLGYSDAAGTTKAWILA